MSFNQFDDIKTTSEYIIRTVSPVFNKKGYAGTSLSDLSKATGLTKGAIYGNFKNKEELAVQVFKYNIRLVLSDLTSMINNAKRPIDKLYAITNFYRGYYDHTKQSGGCPILNVGSDTKYTNPVLFRLVKVLSRKLEKDIEGLILDGIKAGEFNKEMDIKKMARNLYSMIEGSMFMATIHDDRTYLNNMMDHVDEIIKEKITK